MTPAKIRCFRPVATDMNFIRQHPHVRRARKREFLVQVEFCRAAGHIQSLEGLVQVNAGDAVVTGRQGERWCVPLAAFDARYRPAQADASRLDGSFYSRAIDVFALQMNSNFSVLLSDGVSLLQGRAKDWLIDYGDGHLGVVARDIFVQTYQLIF